MFHSWLQGLTTSPQLLLAALLTEAQGGDDTFAGFPEHLRALVSHAFPNITVQAVTYPKFETRGDLKQCVGNFREWLQNQVIDIEVANGTPSPTIDPSVHVILLGHSMGGIVAAETLLAITSDFPIPSHPPTNVAGPLPSTAAHTETQPNFPSPLPELQTFMFPCIHAILAFDTPYLGISPGVIAHGAETHWRTASGAYNALSEVASVLGYSSSARHPLTPQQKSQKLLTQGADAMTASMTASSQDAAATPTWQRWGKYAMFAGAAGAVAAGGAAAYLNRDTITEGWSFIGSHLEFVGCLARGEELKGRLDRIVALNHDRGIGFANIVTVLGKSAAPAKQTGTQQAGAFVESGVAEGIVGPERTFCTVPKSERNRDFFEKARNDHAADEVEAHMDMFSARKNAGYFGLRERAKVLIVAWVEKGKWYKESEPLGRGEKMGLEGVMVDVAMGDESQNPWAGEEPVIVEK